PGTPQGGILSPLPANIALSALDDHFDRQWRQEMGTSGQRQKRKRHGQGNWKLIRYADDLVLMATGATPKNGARRWQPCSHHWGCGRHRRRPGWSTSTRALTSPATTSAGCASGERVSTTSIPSRPGKPFRRSRTR